MLRGSIVNYLVHNDLRSYPLYRLFFVGQIIVCYAEIHHGTSINIREKGNKYI